MLNKVFLIGRLGQDAETHFSSAGNKIVKFSMATEERWKDNSSGEMKKAVEWHRVTLFNGAEYYNDLKKGMIVAVEGRIKTEKYMKSEKEVTATGIIASRLIVLPGINSEDIPY
jgi:single-strand DNA-binding protein